MRSVEDLAAFQSQSVNLTGGERPDRIRGAFVSANFFDAFHLAPILGRVLAKGEDQPGAAKIAVVSEKLWRERLNASSDLADKKLLLNGEAYSVVGVLPSTFQHPYDPDVVVWLSMMNYPGLTKQRDLRRLTAIGHLKPGLSPAQAQAEANTIAAQWAAAYPKENAGRATKIDLFRDAVIGNARSILTLLFCAAGAILLIACANLANLLLARGLARQREMAVRAALGASRWRLVRQLLTETTVLGLAGGATGVLLAHWGLWGLLKLPQNFVTAQDASIDSRVLFFAFALAIVTGWLFGLIPAMQLARAELQSGLKEGGRSSGGGARWNRMRGGFVVAQVAFSILLLIAAGLLIRSFGKLVRSELGFESKNLLTLEYRLPRAKYTEADAPWNFHRQVLDRVQEIPGVKSAAVVRGLPFTFNTGMEGIALVDRETPPAGREPRVIFNVANGNFFNTAQIPLLRGRLFDDRDRADTPAALIINQTMARKFWPEADPIGKTLLNRDYRSPLEIIGIVGDVRGAGLNAQAKPEMYTPLRGFWYAFLVLRTKRGPSEMASAVRKEIAALDSGVPTYQVATMDQLLSASVANERFNLFLLVLVAALALGLAAVGIYGVLAFGVSRRSREIGIRLALGARPRAVLRLVVRQGMQLVIAGVLLGIAGALALTRLMASLLYGVSPTDPATFVFVSALLTMVALIACYFPARRAMHVDPMVALRVE